MSSFTRFWVTHHVIGVSWYPLVVTVPATAGVVTALILPAICRTSPCRHMVLANPPNDLARSNLFATPGRSVPKLPPLKT